jgi:hypothetical protein
MNEWMWSIGGMMPTGKLKYSKKNLNQCHSVHHKSHMDWPETGPGPLW